jgi:ATP:ADP antiporter, AAA family
MMRLAQKITQAEKGEVRAVLLAFACNFVLFASYYILRPLRDTMATVFGAGQLQELFTGTFVLTMLCAPLFSAVAARVKLTRFLPGLFWLWFSNILVFYVLFRAMPESRWVAAGYFWWFSTVNLFLISVFWTLMADIFSPAQATRLFAFIAAGSSTGAIAGPLITTQCVGRIGADGLLLVAAAGFLVVIVLVHLLMREKQKLRAAGGDTQHTSLAHSLPGNPFSGFGLLLKSRLMMGQALFMLLMTWIATVIYFLQTGLIAQTYTGLASRIIAFADVDLVVNIAAALILIFGLGRLVQRFGVTWGLILSPLIMIGACIGVALSPSLLMVQIARSLQRISQYAIARPSREILFTVADQQSKYKAKNVIDTVVYRFGDLTSAWMQAGLKLAGFGLMGAMAFGIGISAAWAGVAFGLGQRFEAVRKHQAAQR